MKRLFIFFLFLFLFTSCTKGEDLKTTRAMKWKMLEDVYLFEDTASNEAYTKLKKDLKWALFLNNEEAIKEEKAWKEAEIDFFIDHDKILEALKTSSTYKVLETEKKDSDITEKLSNGMIIKYSKNMIYIYFPKEESNFRRVATFPVKDNHSVDFQGEEIGGIVSPVEFKVSFSDTDYEILFYSSPLSERAWEKIFFISIGYYNDFIARNNLKISAISVRKERKKNES